MVDALAYIDQLAIESYNYDTYDESPEGSWDSETIDVHY